MEHTKKVMVTHAFNPTLRRQRQGISVALRRAGTMLRSRTEHRYIERSCNKQTALEVEREKLGGRYGRNQRGKSGVEFIKPYTKHM